MNKSSQGGRYFPRLRITREKTLLVDGPASLILQEGSATTLGAPLHIGTPLPVVKYRRTAVQTETTAVLQAWIGENGYYRQVEGSTIPPSWREAAEALRKTKGIAIILGDVDSGKSTLCTYLANTCLDHKVRASIIDGDVGQADIGPPTTVSSSNVSKHIHNLQDLQPERSYFIGDTSPTLVPDKHVQSILRLKDDLADQRAIKILNTDGWIREEEAIDHKQRLLTKLRPSLVLGLCTDHELDPILGPLDFLKMKLEASRYARTRTREQRKRGREEGYRRFLRNHKNLELRLSAIKLRSFNHPMQERIHKQASHRGNLAGLIDHDGSLLSIGRIIQIGSGKIRIATPFREEPAAVELGAIVLSSTFIEVGFES